MHKRAVAVAVLLFAVLGTVVAQESGIFAPFPSRLRVAVRDPRVRLTWRDAAADVSAYRIYRHTEEITDDNLDAATLLETVPAGTETYLDEPQPGTYHYAVVAENADGSVFRVLIPFRNRTTEPVRITETLEQEEPAEAATMVRSITAGRDADGVEITFDAAPDDAAVVLYRSAQPLDSTDALARATRIAELQAADGALTDFPVPGVSYYYGLFPAEALTEGDPVFEPGVTVTDAPVEIPLTTTRVTLPPFEGGPRSRNPLPFLRISRELDGGDAGLPQNPSLSRPALELDEETAAAVARVLETLPDPAPEPLEPQILPRDRAAAEKGPASALATIVTGPFSERRWEEAGRLLDNLLSTTLPEDVESRSHFYRAQTYYFTDRPRPAFLEFLLAREDYYLEARPWTERILNDLEAESGS